MRLQTRTDNRYTAYKKLAYGLYTKRDQNGGKLLHTVETGIQFRGMKWIVVGLFNQQYSSPLNNMAAWSFAL